MLAHTKSIQYKQLFLASSLVMLGACGTGGSSTDANVQSTPVPSSIPAQSNELIKINQVGYLPAQTKIAIVPNTSATSFELRDAATNAIVLSGELSNARTWGPAAQIVKQADFSAVTAAGTYVLKVSGVTDSHPIIIGSEVYAEVHDATVKAYYFNRASIELTPQYAGDWARPLGHPDTNVLVHTSAASGKRPTGTRLSSPKGWYDAGDYNKYIVNSGISTYTLLAAYSDYPDFYQNRDINIPESGDSSPDILDEIKWNIDWMLSMQDENDGGVYHKLTTLGFEGALMPDRATSQRYVVQKGTSAALNFAAVMAKASRVYADIGQFTDEANTYKDAAIAAYSWAKANPNVAYEQPEDVSTGEYGDSWFDDEFAWAAAELYLLTEQSSYLADFNQYAGAPNTPSWQDTMALGHMSLLQYGESLLSSGDMQNVRAAIIGLSDAIVSQHSNSAFAVAMEDDDFVWGSNGVVSNKAMILMQAFQATNDEKYKVVAVGLVDYVLGKNPTDYSFVTGFGVKQAMDPHHRQSYSDSVQAPVPGFVVGGPQPGQQDGCTYPSPLPALSYLDDWCSYSANEVTINWNAPMVYMLASLQSEY